MTATAQFSKQGPGAAVLPFFCNSTTILKEFCVTRKGRLFSLSVSDLPHWNSHMWLRQIETNILCGRSSLSQQHDAIDLLPQILKQFLSRSDSFRKIVFERLQVSKSAHFHEEMSLDDLSATISPKVLATQNIGFYLAEPHICIKHPEQIQHPKS